MTQTLSIRNVRATEVATTVPTVDRSKLLGGASAVVSADGLTRTIDYGFAAADPAFPQTVRCVIKFDPLANKGFGQTTITWSIVTRATSIDDSSGAVNWDYPVYIGTTLRIPGIAGVVSVADLIDLIGNLYTLSFDGVDVSTDPNTSVVDRWANGFPTLDV